MKYQVETLEGKAFSIDCDPCERLLSALRRAALEAGYDDSAYLSFDGKRLDESSEIGTLGVDPKLDVLILHGAAKPASATKRDAAAAAAGDDELHASPEAAAAAAAAAQGRGRRGPVAGQQAGAAAAASVPSLEGVRDALNGKRAENARPTFLSRKKREQLRQQQEEAAAQAARDEEERLQGSRRAAYDEAAKAAKEAAAAAEAEAAAAASSRRQKKPVAAKSGGGGGGGEDSAEASALVKIQQRYLGGKKEKKAVVKMADRSGGSVPDTWDPKDDTTGDAVWSVSNQLLFGRGFIGGTDAVQQMHERGDMDYEDLLKERQNRELQERTLAMQRRNANREAAAKLDRATQDESQKEA